MILATIFKLCTIEKIHGYGNLGDCFLRRFILLVLNYRVQSVLATIVGLFIHMTAFVDSGSNSFLDTSHSLIQQLPEYDGGLEAAEVVPVSFFAHSR